MKTFTMFRFPCASLNTRIVLFESFLEAQNFRASHPEMMDEEIEAKNIHEARRVGTDRMAQLMEEYEQVAMW